jgi:hypothetical protein
MATIIKRIFKELKVHLQLRSLHCATVYDCFRGCERVEVQLKVDSGHRRAVLGV